MAADTVQIAVRMRPFNSREKALQTPKCVEMTNQMVTVTDVEADGGSHSFSFNYCYDSFDAESANFATQERVFADLGISYLENAWRGYNCSIFAYGQTGAGKSFSMTGAPDAEGIIPRGLKEMFRRIEANTDRALAFRVEVSYLEIYMEKIRDLFNPKQTEPSLKVRESPKLGIYCEGLKTMQVGSYGDIEKLMQMGNTLRTVAQTNMNATSSRSHSVLTILLTQTRIDEASMSASDMTSKINLIDLAGSERQDKTGAEGTRLKEGSAINQSLTALGNVIETLADLSQMTPAQVKASQRVVPYRDSKLTRILQESLGGNAKTIMVAAISPAADNFKETLSTLRYANRASKIKNAAVVNESPNDKAIRELKEEVAKLREMLDSGGGAGAGASGGRPNDEVAAELAALKAQLASKDRFIELMALGGDDRASAFSQSVAVSMLEMASGLRDLVGTDLGSRPTEPHLLSLHNSALTYVLSSPRVTIGRAKDQNIVLGGVFIQPAHCCISYEDGVHTLALAADDCLVYRNGLKLFSPAVLEFGDRIVIGNNHFFFFEVPALRQSLGANAPPVCDVSFAEGEIKQQSARAQIEPESAETDDASVVRNQLQASLAEIGPMTDEANAIAKKLNKPIAFETKFEYDLSSGLAAAKMQLRVRVLNTETGAEALWTHARFEERLVQLRDACSTLAEFGGAAAPGNVDELFAEPPQDRMIGLAHLLLISLAEGIAMPLSTPIWDLDGGYIGTAEVFLAPADGEGKPLPYSQVPQDWMQPGSVARILIRIVSANGVPASASPLYVQYSLFNRPVQVSPVSHALVNHNIGWDAVHEFSVSREFIDYILQAELVIQLVQVCTAAGAEATQTGPSARLGAAASSAVQALLADVADDDEDAVAGLDSDGDGKGK